MKVKNWIKRILLSFVVFTTFSACDLSSDTSYSNHILKKKEISAIWFSYLDYQELAQNVSVEEFNQIVDQVISNCEYLNINTIYVHAIAFTDSFYNSEIYPQTAVLGEVDFDPLRIFAEKAHKNNIRVEAWINPMRSVLTSESKRLDGTILGQWIKENNERIRPVDNRYYLNPAYPEVRELICTAVEEILDNYEVDGIHLDDYFYPAETEIKFDAYIYGKATSDQEITREDFRRNCINQLVSDLHKTVKNKSEKYSFGISVAGNLENNINLYFANPSDWIEAKTVDYLIPQIYWGFDHPIKPYAATLEEWMSLTKNSDTEMYAGLAAYKVGVEDVYAGDAADEWVVNNDILARQIDYSFEHGCKGIALFRYNSLLNPSAENLGNVEKEIINIKNVLSGVEGLSK